MTRSILCCACLILATTAYARQPHGTTSFLRSEPWKGTRKAFHWNELLDPDSAALC
jgi:hypothetical protein